MRPRARGGCPSRAVSGRASARLKESSDRDLEDPRPSELGEFRLVRVEHVAARMLEAELENPPLTLHLGNRIRELGGCQAGARRVVMEEISVQVEGVALVVLERVGEVNPHRLADLELDRVLVVVKGNPVDLI